MRAVVSTVGEAEEANTIAQLLKQKDGFDRVANPVAPEGVPTRPVKDYEAFESRTDAFNAVMEALKESNLSIIGVYGMSGVGKTTLVKQVARQAKEENLFHEVVMATVTLSFDINSIQDQIAEELGGKKLDKQSDAGRAGELRNRLKNSEKVLVILDDIWVKLDLEAVGIPYGAEHHQGCKILLTSRERNVLSLMDSQQDLAIEVLKEDEAWNLFKKMAGDTVLSPDLHPIAIEVAKKCAGLPIAIVTVGKGMKNKKNVYEWRNALQELRRPSKINFRGIPADVYSAIELSYKFLEDVECQSTFLLCSIMGHDADIEDLLIYVKGLGIFHGVDSIQEARDKVLILVSNLKASGLLVDGSTPRYSDRREHFDMHDVVRDVAISISSRDQHWLALGRDDVFKEWSDEETMRRCNLISLRDAKVRELPDELGCPNLTFFSMVSKDSSLKIPDNFFKGMQGLKVSNFAKMHFSSLPLSISSLKNLHTLCFPQCKLEDIAIIGELKNLEILNLRDSTTATLPREIGQLTKLKLLDLSGCYDLEVISANVLSRLSSLEELYLYDSFDGWEVEVEGHDNPRSNASLVELNNLSHLTTLEVHIPNHQAMPKDNLFLQKLERYKISIGESWYWLEDKLETSRMFKVELNESINLYDVVKMLQKIENLCLNGVKNVENMLHDPDNEGFPHLQHLSIKNVSEIKYVNNSMKLVSCIAFPLLVSLTLEKLINLKNICYGQLKAGSFSQLKTMKVTGCHTLRNLFSVSVARGLCQLQLIAVSDCENIAKIVADEDGNIGDIEESGILEFPQLRTLVLNDLPELKIFYSAEERGSSSRQEGIQSTIDASSDVVTPFFNQKVALPMLEHLKIQRLTNLERLWPNQLADESYPKLIQLELRWCDKLLNVFPLSMSRRLQRLNKLMIWSCNLLEEIFEPQQDHSSFIKPFSPKLIQSFEFPQVTYLLLHELPKLKGFYHEMHTTNWPSLKHMWMSGCDKVEILFASHEKMEMSQQDVSIRRALFWVNKVAFPAIEELELYNCNKLKYVFTSSTVKSFVQLKTLKIQFCDKIEEVISVTQGLVEEDRVVFPKLEHLSLSFLHNLRRFCCGSPIEFPSLKKLQISDCDVLNTFHCDCTYSVGKRSSISMDHNLRVPQCLFNHKVAFPAIKELELFRCNKLKYVFTSSTVKSFVQLKTLKIQLCDKIEEVISVTQGLVEEDRVVFPKLEQLSLSFLPNLRRFCCGSPIEFPSLKKLQISYCDVLNTFHCDCTYSVGKRSSISMDHNLRVPQCLFNHKVAFPAIEELELHNCNKLKYVFTSSTVKSFVQLKTLKIQFCDEIQEVISVTQGLVEEERVVFPKLEHLCLLFLPNLKRFCCGSPIEFPSLKKLQISDCDVLNTFHCDCTYSVGKSSSISMDHNLRTRIRVPQCLFNHKFTFPNLESLELGWNAGMKEIWHACGQQQLASDYLCKLKDVQVHGITKKFSMIPLCLLQLLSLPNLEKLQIDHVHCKEIFQSEGVGGEEMLDSAWVVLSRVTELRLKYLFKLMHLWKEKEGFQNLRILEVEMCPKLKNCLVPSSVSFQNLVTLKVQNCGGITKLVTHSTAKTLVQLKEMTIDDCDKMKEIIEGSWDDEDEVKIEISLPRLNSLELVRLPKLKSFCSSGNYAFAFPSLENVRVEYCPKMKMFSQGDSSTPMLHNVYFEKKEGHRSWEGNLNSTIQQLFKQTRKYEAEMESWRHLEAGAASMQGEEAVPWAKEQMTRERTSAPVEKPLSAIESVPSLAAENLDIITDKNEGTFSSHEIEMEAARHQKEKGHNVLEVKEDVSQSSEPASTSGSASSAPSTRASTEPVAVIPSAKDVIPVMDEAQTEIPVIPSAKDDIKRMYEAEKESGLYLEAGAASMQGEEAIPREKEQMTRERTSAPVEKPLSASEIVPSLAAEIILEVVPDEKASSSTTSADGLIFSRVAAGLIEPPTEEEWKQSKMMFLMDNELSTLPEKPNCPKLVKLDLQMNYHLIVIPDLFFHSMPLLEELNLSMTRIKYLPKSISNLVKLEKLVLRDCERLVNLPSEVGSLKLLQVLDLGGTEIIDLPNEISKLVCLSHLEVSFYGSSTNSEHDKLPRKWISSLQALQTLRISMYPGDSWWNKTAGSFLKEVINLKKLTSLSFYFPEVEFLELFLRESASWKSLTEFKFVVGRDIKFNASRVPQYVELNYGLLSGQCLRFVNSEKIPTAIVEVLARCIAFYLDHHLDVRSLSEFGIGNINKLKYCIISECPNLETIVDSKEGAEIVFPCLEHLSIHYSWSLTCIWEGVVPKGSFAALRTLSLHACPKLTYVFKSSMLQFISNLEKLQVDDCEAIEKIVSAEEDTESCCISLKSLTLNSLPELIHISEGVQSKLLFEYISVCDCPQLKHICVDSELKQTLKEIRAEKDWWDELVREENAIPSDFEAIFTPIREGDVHVISALAPELDIRHVEVTRDSDTAITPVEKPLSETEIVPSLAAEIILEVVPDEKASSSTTSADGLIFSRVAAGLIEPPTEEEWKQSKMMFLMDNELSTLPEKPNCPKLVKLDLQMNYHLRVIPDLFFDSMPLLKELNLSITRIKYLPKSISNLVKLEKLVLRDCERLVNLPSEVGSLKLLQVLDLGGTEIIDLPNEISKLVCLSHLEVSFYGSSTNSKHDKLPRRWISSLQALQTLRISMYPGDSWWNKTAGSFLKEVINLKKLTSLSFYFPEVEFLELFLRESASWKSLTEFKFVVGRDIKFNASRVPQYVELNYGLLSGQCLKFVNSEKIPTAIVEVLARCIAFYLDHHLDVRSLSEFGIGNINKLKYCIISECPNLETIVDSKEGAEIVFPCLEHLSIHYSWSLTCIWEGVVPKGSFAALRTLSLHACPKLTYVFKSSMLQFLSNLEELQVDDCEAIEKIVSAEEDTESCCISLKSLTLNSLPEMTRISEGVQGRLLFEYISVYDCPQLKQICVDSELKQTLKEMRAEKDWWDELVREENAIPSDFEAIFTAASEGDYIVLRTSQVQGS